MTVVIPTQFQSSFFFFRGELLTNLVVSIVDLTHALEKTHPLIRKLRDTAFNIFMKPVFF